MIYTLSLNVSRLGLPRRGDDCHCLGVTELIIVPCFFFLHCRRRYRFVQTYYVPTVLDHGTYTDFCLPDVDWVEVHTLVFSNS